MSDIKLGLFPNDTAQRDAIHIAIAPVTSDEPMYPGQCVALVEGTNNKVQSLRGGDPLERGIGIVDPFLPSRVNPQTRFWLLLHPQTITSLRHDWTHPAFANAKTSISASERWLREKADRVGVPYHAMLEVSVRDDYPCGFGVEIDGEREIEPEFWVHLANVTGKTVPEANRPQYFHCAC